MTLFVRTLLVCLIPACLACLLALVAVAAPAEGIHKRTAVDVQPIERRFTQPAAKLEHKSSGPSVSGRSSSRSRTRRRNASLMR